MKTNSAAKKRFDFTGTGKIKRKHAYHSHILTKKTTKQKRNLDYSALVAPADEAKVKSLLVKEHRLLRKDGCRTVARAAGKAAPPAPENVKPRVCQPPSV